MLKVQQSHEPVFCFDNSIQGAIGELAIHAGNHCPNIYPIWATRKDQEQLDVVQKNPI